MSDPSEPSPEEPTDPIEGEVPSLDELGRPPVLREGPLVGDVREDRHDGPAGDPDEVEIADGTGCGRKVAAGIGVVALVSVLVLLGGWWWVRAQLDPGGKPGALVTLEVPSGASTADIGTLLAQEGIVPNARVFRWWVGWKNRGPFQAGRYELHRNSSVAAAADVLERGPLPPKVVKVSIPEGFRVSEIIDRIHEVVPRFSTQELRALLDDRRIASVALPPDSNNYEGLLFPATYEVTEEMTAEQLLQQMAAAMDERVSTPDFTASAGALNLTPYELLTAASLVQAEAGNPDEAPKIARVIYNRLRTSEPLGIDATSRYLSILTGEPVDFESASPYNTRRQVGLPPTPITAPGDFAIQAALHPADGPWIWYVRDVNNDAQGRPQHVFTESAAEFERAKRACRDAGLGCG